MITGYNTDVEFNGVVYHVQTEDKGLQTPIILSLVYVGGAILASKRSPYDDLIAAGFDKQILTDRLQRQHKLICAAVHAGRIEDLKRMGERETASHPPPTADEAPAAETARPPDPEPTPVPPSDAVAPPFDSTPLTVNLVDEPDFRGGATVEMNIFVSQAAENGRVPAAQVRVVVKILSTAFSPSKVETVTNPSGLATVSLKFPDFRGGRAAVLVQVEHEGMRAELRRIIVPSN